MERVADRQPGEGTGFRTDTSPVMKLVRAGSPEVDIFVSTVESATRITAALDTGVPLRDVQEAASHAQERRHRRRDRVAGEHQPPGVPARDRAEPQQRLGQVQVRDAAQELGMSRATIYRKLAQYDIHLPRG